MYDLGILGGEIYVDGNFVKKNIYIKDGIIAKIDSEYLEATEIINVLSKKVLPGLIDPHVHFELGGGRFSSADDFQSGSICAAYGGITTFIDFLDPIGKANELEAALELRKKAAKKSVIDYGFHATIKNPIGEVDLIVEEMKRLKLHRVKLFTTYSDSGRRTGDLEIHKLLQHSKEDGLLVLAHIEDDAQIVMNAAYQVKDLGVSRPSSAETDQVLKLAKMVQETGGKLYMVHCSSGKTIEKLKEVFSELLNEKFIIESCPHYFVFNEEVYQREDGALFTMAPPLRSKEEQVLLIKHFEDVLTIGTDHCPFIRSVKEQEYLKDIPMGMGGVEHSFQVMFQLFGNQVIDKMTLFPAKVHGIYPKKGVLQEGSDGDIIIIDERVHHITTNHSKCDYSTYKSFRVNTEILSTLVRGKFIIKDGEYVGGQGEYIEG